MVNVVKEAFDISVQNPFVVFYPFSGFVLIVAFQPLKALLYGVMATSAGF